MLKKIALKIIKIYQKTLSPDTGWFSFKNPYGYCKHFPTCSNYTYQAIEKYGTIRGSLKGFFRILRCNPLTKGGYDPLK
ncbi:membrane protein insertion efficiency factor YidD [bacterium]|jgi:uncharacterized protein|nr:membrane protein insertion efficiency factor YidD [bacterium]MBT4121921.1 membrane protein insertion efficiency factor YidD [bacterium]MBT4335180.1 membrane protein insertion efficiency factor YidD [bacterium]MBT4495427.1 membrane protein insertion efficiency factor YidD [bacterium]MBT4763652.1 membrane protein insertion efficiency factor YidD [bacterium]